MHEYSLVLALIEQVDRHLEGQPPHRVRRVSLRVGEQSGVVPALLATAFDAARAHTACADAELVVHEVAARWCCSRCERELADGDVLECASCGAPARLVAGEELDLMRIELEVVDDV